jgi:hypothetical protein
LDLLNQFVEGAHKTTSVITPVFRFMKIKLCIAFFASFLVAVCANEKTAASADYEIKLVREGAVGSSFRVNATGSSEEAVETTVDGQTTPVKSEKYSVEIVVVCEVLAKATPEHGAKNKLIVEKMNMTQQDQTEKLLEAGTEVIEERISGATQFSVGGKPVAEKVAKAFAAVGFSMKDFGSANDDDIFGTKGRKKVGDSWPINSTAAANDFSKDVFPVKPENISGSTAVKELVTVGNQKCLVISATMAMRDLLPPAPQGLEAQPGEANAVFSGIFPVDVTKIYTQETGSLDLKVVYSGSQAGKKVLVQLTHKASYTSKFSAR